MLALFISSLLLTFFSIIIGIFVAKIISIEISNTEKFLIGLVMSNSITSLISLFYPINLSVLIFFIAGCIILSYLISKELKSFCDQCYKKRKIILYAIPLILIAFNISLYRPIHYDTGLYYLQSIKWIENYPVVPGLANLHGRFGFNPNIFTLFALISLRDIFNQEIFSINFVVLSALILYFVNKLYLLNSRNGFSNLTLFYAFVLYTILRLNNYLSPPTPDFLTIAILLYIFVRFFDLSHQNSHSKLIHYIPIILFSIYILTIKLAALPIILLILFIIIKYIRELKKTFWRLFPILSFLIIPWLIRNIILTGWLVYPFHFIDLFSFDWKVPKSDLISMCNAVTGYARISNEHYKEAANMNFLSWFPIWWQRIELSNKIYFVCSLAFPIIILMGQLTKKVKIPFSTTIIILTSFVGVIFWLFMAPDFRFGKSFLIIGSISPLLCLFFSWTSVNKFYINLGVFIILLASLTIGNIAIIKGNTYQVLHSNRLILPQFIQIPKDLNFTMYKVSDYQVFVPNIGDQCFDHDLPCTPYYDSTLVLRRNTIESGFKHILKK
jgi:hypothetical protein